MKLFGKNFRQIVGKASARFSLFALALCCCFSLFCLANAQENPVDSAFSASSVGKAAIGGLVDAGEFDNRDVPNLKSDGVWGEQLATKSGDDDSSLTSIPEQQSESTDSPLASDEGAGNESENTAVSKSASDFGDALLEGPRAWLDSDRGWFGRSGISTSLKALLVMSILSLAPAILLTTTSFVRVSVVLSLLRQALGAGQIPSNQVIAALSFFLTLLVMEPVWSDVYKNAVEPYAAGKISNVEAFEIGQVPIRSFLWRQIERSGNAETINVFAESVQGLETPEYYEDVPWRVLLPAFVLSELKTAFLIGFQIFLPFLIVDLVVSCVLVSSGMMMLPPAIVSLPFKLILFVLADGWTLVIKSLLVSFAPTMGT
ncbi:MAG: flagellar type III secretion system pore protein FliP [Thermoguttaceae bacterium]|nr:flagellar type III secretion system pore protein FliP [Thermoguttaceae bacterium]